MIRTEQEDWVVPEGPDNTRNQGSGDEAASSPVEHKENPRQPVSSTQDGMQGSFTTAIVAVKKR